MNSNSGRIYNLEERTAKFGEDIIILCMALPKNEITRPIVNQLIKCGTSIGANYSEADDAESKRDFKHKIGISKKEARETKHFLRMLKVACPKHTVEIERLHQEATELHLILNSIYRKINV